MEVTSDANVAASLAPAGIQHGPRMQLNPPAKNRHLPAGSGPSAGVQGPAVFDATGRLGLEPHLPAGAVTAPRRNPAAVLDGAASACGQQDTPALGHRPAGAHHPGVIHRQCIDIAVRLQLGGRSLHAPAVGHSAVLSGAHKYPLASGLLQKDLRASRQAHGPLRSIQAALILHVAGQ